MYSYIDYYVVRLAYMKHGKIGLGARCSLDPTKFMDMSTLIRLHMHIGHGRETPYATPNRITCLVFILHGGSDETCPEGTSEKDVPQVLLSYPLRFKTHHL